MPNTRSRAKNYPAQPSPRLAPSDTNTPSSDVSGPATSSSPPQPTSRRKRRAPSAGLRPAGPSAPRTISATDGVVRRMHWDTNLNISVMRAYYRATEGGTRMTAYRARLLTVFQELEPAVTVTAQRLADQVRVIRTHQFLDDVVLDQLRCEELPPASTADTALSQSQLNLPSTELDVAPTDNIAVPVVEAEDNESQVIESIRRSLEEAILLYRSTPPDSRPRIPRLPTSKRNITIVCTLDSLLPPFLESCTNITDTHSILYCAAVAACNVAGVKFNNETRVTGPRPAKPSWQLRIERRIEESRVLIGKLISYKSGNHRPRIMRFVTRAFLGTDVPPSLYMARVTERIDYLKQKVSAWAKRIRRYRKRVDRYNINRIFQKNQRGVYRNWENPERHVTDMDVPTPEDMTKFWRDVWSQPVSHVEDSWFSVVERACNSVGAMEAITITEEDVRVAARRAHNWKSPGPDGLQNFWLKWLHSCHARLATQYQELIEEGNLPVFMTTGITHLLYKSGSSTEPKNYRPITCLPTLYKLLTSILTNKINCHLNKFNILSICQNGCRAGSRGTKELLLIDTVISERVRRTRKNLSVAWIDYKKAFDSVPHTWLLRILRLYKINTTLYRFLKTCMGQWITVLRQPGGEISSGAPDPIKIQRGIFQGDSLSPLWFCLALNPLSTLLEDSGLGFKLRRDGESISHLLYMDDLKLFAPNRSDLSSLMNLTERFSRSIGMEFGVDKCAIMHVEKGKIVMSDRVQLSDTTQIPHLSEFDTYKYLGVAESLGIKSADIKQTVSARFLQRLSKVLNSLLSGGNKIRAYNGWVMPVLAYTFGVLKWTQGELDALDRKVRSLMTATRVHHPRSSVMRLYIPRKCGGRGLLNTKNLHNREICNLREYFLKKSVGMHRDVVMSDHSFTPLCLAKENWHTLAVLSTEDRKEIWRSKELHGRYFRALHSSDVDQLTSLHWLRFGDLFGETEGFVCAIQDEVIKTNNYSKFVMKDGTVDICRACHQPGESLRHITSGCPHLANTEYLHRHNQVARIIHQQIALKYLLIESEKPYYQYSPQPVLENDRALLYWDRSIITDRTIVANKPDIVIVDRAMRRAMLVDITIPHDGNLVKAEIDKLSKYQDLAHEVTAMWHVDSTIIVPVVVTVNGLFAKSFDQHLKKLSLDSWVKGQIQKAVLLDTARIVRRFLSLGT